MEEPTLIYIGPIDNQKENGECWFCADPVISDGGDKKEFDDKAYPFHEKYFDKERLAMIYICHDMEEVFVKKYDITPIEPIEQGGKKE